MIDIFRPDYKLAFWVLLCSMFGNGCLACWLSVNIYCVSVWWSLWHNVCVLYSKPDIISGRYHLQQRNLCLEGFHMRVKKRLVVLKMGGELVTSGSGIMVPVCPASLHIECLSLSSTNRLLDVSHLSIFMCKYAAWPLKRILLPSLHLLHVHQLSAFGRSSGVETCSFKEESSSSQAISAKLCQENPLLILQITKLQTLTPANSFYDEEFSKRGAKYFCFIGPCWTSGLIFCISYK